MQNANLTLTLTLTQLVIKVWPHLALLSKEFYHAELKDLMAQWAMVWLKRQPQVQEAVQQVLAGMAQRGLDQCESLGDLSEMSESKVHAALLRYVQATKGDDFDMATDMVSTWMVPQHPVAVKMLNLAKDWVTNFLPHCFSKVNRVSFGLLKESDKRRWAKLEGVPPERIQMPQSRELLAVPFQALEVPSRNSEFQP